MDLGLAFDDSDFETKEKSRAGLLTSYNAKICLPLWFEEGGGSAGDPDWLAQRLKFSGDYHYHMQDYDTAAAKYRQLVDLIHENNTSMRQDVEESLCRCYMKLNQHSKSLQLANKLVSMMRTEDEAKQRQSLVLLSQVCRHAGEWKGCVSALEELASQQTHYAQFWFQLGQAHFQLALTQTSNSHHGEREESLSAYHYGLITACFVRARLLLESVQSTAGQMARERYEKVIQNIEEEIRQLGVSQDLISRAEEVMKTDIDRHDSSAPVLDGVGDCPDDNTESGEMASYSAEAFRKRWFAWIDRHLETT